MRRQPLVFNLLLSGLLAAILLVSPTYATPEEDREVICQKFLDCGYIIEADRDFCEGRMLVLFGEDSVNVKDECLPLLGSGTCTWAPFSDCVSDGPYYHPNRYWNCEEFRQDTHCMEVTYREVDEFRDCIKNQQSNCWDRFWDPIIVIHCPPALKELCGQCVNDCISGFNSCIEDPDPDITGTQCMDIEIQCIEDCLIICDQDGDTYFDMNHLEEECKGSDCNDDDPDVNPGMQEIPDNGVDEDCDVSTPDYPETANTIAASYGSNSLIGSGVFNSLALLLIPVGGIIFLRVLGRRR